jgi:metal-responsive CopG/Arc/MetJ family transcriptional regulator
MTANGTHESRIPCIIDFMKRITVDLPDDLYERLRLAAFTEHHSVSEAVRDRLASALPQLPASNGDQK